jgi:hypothetical protein
MISLFTQHRYDKLAITCNPKGKYYTLLTVPELETKSKLAVIGSDRLVLYCTFGELKSILQNEQLNLL